MGLGERRLELEFQEFLGQLMAVAVGAVGIVLIGLNAALVGIVSHAQLHVVAGIHDVTPLDGTVQVEVAEGVVGFEGEMVPGPVGKGLDGIAGVGLVGNGCVRILERGLASVIMALLGEQSQDPVGIGGTAAQHEGGLVLGQGALQMEPAGKKTQTQGAAHFAGVTLAGADVQDGRYAAAIFGRDGALVQLGLGHQV